MNENKELKETLEYLYHEGGLSTYQIASQFGVCNVTIWNMLNEFNIPTRTLSESRIGGANPMYGIRVYGKDNANYRHGDSRTRVWKIHSGLKSRCYNPNDTAYKYYGAKGIKMCDEWRNSYPAFRDWALANGYADNLVIDRIDNNKGYSPDNCHWITNLENLRKIHKDYLTTPQSRNHLGQLIG